MRRLAFLSIPVVVAATALVLASTPLAAQDTHDHGTQAAGGHACACCGNSGSGAMNHADGGCCGNMAAAKGAATTEDHSAHQGAQPAAKAEARPMNQAGAGCCGGMNQATAAKAAPGASAGCGGNMAMGAAKTEAKPMDHAAGGCCGGMNHAAGAADAKPMAMGDPAMMSDMQVFHFLLDNRADIHRTVTILPNGIDTLTESDRPEIAAKIKTHVAAMYGRLKDGRRIHQRDPLFVELFEHADQIDANITYTDKGLRVVETSSDPAVALLLHKHAEMVNNFIKNGMAEMMKDHLE